MNALVRVGFRALKVAYLATGYAIDWAEYQLTTPAAPYDLPASFTYYPEGD